MPNTTIKNTALAYIIAAITVVILGIVVAGYMKTDQSYKALSQLTEQGHSEGAAGSSGGVASDIPSVSNGTHEIPTVGDALKSGNTVFVLNRVSSGRTVYGPEGVRVADDELLVFVTLTVYNTSAETRVWNSQDSSRLFDNEDRMYEQLVGSERRAYNAVEEYPIPAHDSVTVPLLFSIPSASVPTKVSLQGEEGDPEAVYSINGS